MNNIEASVVTFAMCDDANTTHVTTTRNHGDYTSVKFDELCDLACCEVDLDGVIDLDDRVRISDPTGYPISSVYSF